MRFFDLVRLIFDNLSRRKGRVALTAVGVIIGTAAVVLLVSLASGLQRTATNQLWGISDLSRIDVYPNYGGEYGYYGPAMRMGGGGGGSSDQPQEKLLTYQAIQEIEALPGVKWVIPRDYLWSGGMLQFGRLETYGGVMGVGTSDLSVFEYTLQEGTTRLDRGTAIVGYWVIRNFYDPKMRPGQEPPPPPDLLDQQIRLVLMKYTSDGQEVRKTVTLRVVGILKETRSEADSSVFLRMEDLTAMNEWVNGKRINRNREGYNNLVVKAENPEQVVGLAEQINTLGYMANTPQSMLEGINSFFVVLQLIFGGVGAIALLVAAIGIANTMTMAILERTREIGLMKAVGASNRDVLSIFLGEAAGIGLIGGLGGVLFGWGGGMALDFIGTTYLANQAAQGGGLPPDQIIYTPVWLLIFALIFATLVGLLSGLYPALRAATLVPVTALKYE